MSSLTGVERIHRILRREPVDRIGVFEHFWGDTHKKWSGQGHIQPGESMEDHFGYDLQLCWPFNTVARLDFTPEVIEETDETQLVRDGNGALLRRHKLHDATPEHVDFLVQDRAAVGRAHQTLPHTGPRAHQFRSVPDRETEGRRREPFFWVVGSERL